MSLYAAEQATEHCLFDAQFCVEWYKQVQQNGYENPNGFWDDCITYTQNILSDYRENSESIETNIIKGEYGENLKAAKI